MKIYCGDKKVKVKEKKHKHKQKQGKVKEKKMETEMEKGKITWSGEVRSGSSSELKWKK